MFSFRRNTSQNPTQNFAKVLEPKTLRTNRYTLKTPKKSELMHTHTPTRRKNPRKSPHPVDYNSPAPSPRPQYFQQSPAAQPSGEKCYSLAHARTIESVTARRFPCAVCVHAGGQGRDVQLSIYRRSAQRVVAEVGRGRTIPKSRDRLMARNTCRMPRAPLWVRNAHVYNAQCRGICFHREVG